MSAPWWTPLAVIVALLVAAVVAGLVVHERRSARWALVEEVWESVGPLSAWRYASDKGWKREAQRVRPFARLEPVDGTYRPGGDLP